MVHFVSSSRDKIRENLFSVVEGKLIWFKAIRIGSDILIAIRPICGHINSDESELVSLGFHFVVETCKRYVR